MNILVLGGGGREHALAWAIKQNPKCDRLIVAPGNAGISEIAETAALDICDAGAVTAFVADAGVDFVVIGPEAPLVAGLADALAAVGVTVFGPSAAAAQLEASKTFTKEICRAADVPTADWAAFDDPDAARAHLERVGAPIVVKADGLAAGKGVTVAPDLPTARAALEALFAVPGARVVLEEMMTGEEASFFVLCDGEDALPIGTAQDHKRAFDGDEGPNTGGMGAYTPAPVLTEAVQAQVMETIIRPTLSEMARRGTPYRGVLYAGLMIDGPEAAPRARLVEYNARFGDPEAQVLMMRLGAQALDLMLACAEGRLGDVAVHWAEDHALTVVLAARGYPGDYARGSAIRGLDGVADDSRHMVFHAGTARVDGQLVAAGGRVLSVTARGASLREAHDRAYAMVDAVDWPEGFCRRDIGWRALPR
ncbi:phosphoribosylamine--glycine ligase [Rhodobaculum claviforme]|uniref:Phosphoribosylamine--glycine ligase n=1 Tax=Rhodobaculum claviforme TaxID=1549854 RepID=A0A934WIJ3_9RHOB|nr:phosphoribosylamine--glycine ligase [Rhodobaculum claviforme]MBK5926623.1 phosphoribosylamine--glycine ligase [Rhodobaculum claviforme]